MGVEEKMLISYLLKVRLVFLTLITVAGVNFKHKLQPNKIPAIIGEVTILQSPCY